MQLVIGIFVSPKSDVNLRPNTRGIGPLFGRTGLEINKNFQGVKRAPRFEILVVTKPGQKLWGPFNTLWLFTYKQSKHVCL